MTTETKQEKSKDLEEILKDDLFSGGGMRSELGEALMMIEEHAVPLGRHQLAGIAFLEYLDRERKQNTFRPIINALLRHRKQMATVKPFIKVVELMYAKAAAMMQKREKAAEKGVKA